MLTGQQRDSFAMDGFLVLDSFVDRQLVDELRRSYDDILAGRQMAQGDRMLGGVTRQIMYPSLENRLFDHNQAVDDACAIAAELLGSDRIGRLFDMLIYKPPLHPHETPWHQDLAYARQPTAPAGTVADRGYAQFWIALDDADEQNGCMHFVPGVHRKPLLEHHVASGDPEDLGRLLALVDPEAQLDLTRVVAAPIPAGGCTIHSYTTPHYTPPNRSRTRPRRAYVVSVGTVDHDVVAGSRPRARPVEGKG